MDRAPGGRAMASFGARLRAVRTAAGLGGHEFAAALGDGWSQSKISKFETGARMPSEQDVIRWAEVAGVDPQPLLALRGKAGAEYTAWRERIASAGGLPARQGEIGALQAASSFIGQYQPAMILGLLQTPAYMREMITQTTIEDEQISPQEIGETIAARVRRASILYENKRRIVAVIGEAALHGRIGTQSRDTMRGQLTHLADLANLPGLEFGVVPFDVPTPVEPISGFTIYDTDLVTIETLGGGLDITDPTEVASYTQRLDRLLAVAVTGDEAAQLCRNIAAESAR